MHAADDSKHNYIHMHAIFLFLLFSVNREKRERELNPRAAHYKVPSTVQPKLRATQLFHIFFQPTIKELKKNERGLLAPKVLTFDCFSNSDKMGSSFL